MSCWFRVPHTLVYQWVHTRFGRADGTRRTIPRGQPRLEPLLAIGACWRFGLNLARQSRRLGRYLVLGSVRSYRPGLGHRS
jgi:hypothetical protein